MFLGFAAPHGDRLDYGRARESNAGVVRGEPQEGQVAADPMTFRRHAEACLRLAESAKTPELSTALLSMAHSWARLADDTEHYETVLLAQCETEPCVGTTPRTLKAWLEAAF